MGGKLGFWLSLYDYIVGEAENLQSRLPKWAVPWISAEYCLLMVYIVGMGVLWGLVLVWVPNKTSGHVKFIDAMFDSFSAATGYGLGILSISSLSTFQLFVLMLVCLMGARVFTTFLELILRLGLSIIRSSPDKEDSIGEHNSSQDRDPVVRAVSEDIIQDQEGVPISADGGSFRPQRSLSETFTEEVRPQSDEIEEFDGRLTKSEGEVLTSIRHRHNKNKWKSRSGALFQKRNENSSNLEVQTRREEVPDRVYEQTIREEVPDRVHEKKVFGYLARIVFTYLVGVQFTGGVLAAIYFAAKQSARAHVKDSGGNVAFFTVFMTISHFANAGFSPIDAGMTPFTKDLGLQIIFAGQMLLGSTMFPVALRAVVWVTRKWSKQENRAILDAMLRNPRRFSNSLYPKKQTIWLAMVMVGCVTLQVSLLLGLMWNDEMINGFSPLEKLVNAVYQSISARHTGVNVWNLGEWTPIVLYAFILIMYVPRQPIYASQDHTNSNGDEKDDNISFQSKKFLFQYSVFVAAAILLICVIENHNIVSDPLNFSVLNIVFEVVSAFMNVGLSVGYSCSLRKEEGTCIDMPYSFSGKWSSASKFVLIITMVVGRLR